MFICLKITLTFEANCCCFNVSYTKLKIKKTLKIVTGTFQQTAHSALYIENEYRRLRTIFAFCLQIEFCNTVVLFYVNLFVGGVPVV